MLDTTPPSARQAAPVTADASGLHTNATTDAISSTVSNRRNNDDGRACSKKSFSICSVLIPLSFAICSTNTPTPSLFVGPGMTVLTVTPVPAAVCAEAARQGELRRLGQAVMDHFRGRVDARFTGNEHDAAPFLGNHLRQVKPAQAHAAEHVDLKEFVPVGVGDIGKRLGLEDTDVVHQNVHGGQGAGQGFDALGGAEVGGEAVHLGVGAEFRAQAGGGFIRPPARAAVDGDVRALARQGCRDGVADARGRAADESRFSFELQVHKRKNLFAETVHQIAGLLVAFSGDEQASFAHVPVGDGPVIGAMIELRFVGAVLAGLPG